MRGAGGAFAARTKARATFCANIVAMLNDSHVPPPDDSLFAYVRDALESPIDCVIFTERRLSEVFGLRLTDGREIVAKMRPFSDRIQQCCEVQRKMFEAGYPAPEPLTPATAIDDWLVSIETYVPDGAMFVAGPDMAERFAQEYARFMTFVPDASDIGAIAPLPWVASGSGGSQLWPTPNEVDADLNAIDGPLWVDEAARFAKQRIARHDGAIVVGHGDWSCHNLQWRDRELYAVHDWDSIVTEPELVTAGVAAGFFPADGNPRATATVDQTRAFIDAYGIARGRTWSNDDREVMWAAGLWNRAYDAKQQTVQGEIRTLTREEALERMSLAGSSN